MKPIKQLLCTLLCLAALLPGAFALTDPDIQATAAILVNPDTGMVLYEKNADKKAYPASTTKIMTALLTLENVNLDDIVTAEEVDLEGITWDTSNADIKVGEQVTVEDLLYCLMLPSANEAANMLARWVGGTKESFVDMMNARAQELGCTGTHFVNPNGLHDDDHYTTARDLEKIAEAAMKNETFATIANTAVKTIHKTNMHEERQVLTTNMLIFRSSDPWYYPWAKGIKTGHTSQAGYCLVSYAEKRSARQFSVVLGCLPSTDGTVEQSFTETSRLFDWGYDNFASVLLAGKGMDVTEVPIRLSTETDHLVLTAKEDLNASVPKDLDPAEMELTTDLPADIVAPIKAGDPIGTMTYSYDGVDYGTVALVALHDVELSRVLFYADKLENFFRSTFFKVALLVLAVFFLLYIGFNLLFGRVRRSRSSAVRRARRSRYNGRRR